MNRRNWKELPPHIGAAHRALTEALREIRECSPRTQAQIAKDACQEPTTLSNHLNAGRIPDESLLRGFYATVEKDAATAGNGPLPHTLEDLLCLRLDAKTKHCACCTVGYPATTEQLGTPTQQPASRIVSNPGLARARRLRRRSRRREISVPEEHTAPPVPLREGDRRPTESAELTWPETKLVARYLADGQKHEAGFLLWQAGASYSAPGIVEAVTSCRTAGLDDAAEAILISVTERVDRQAVLNVAAALDDAGRHKDVNFMLTAATRSAG
ncbi:hypothetical protein ABZ434_11870 [Streptomyces sp. NPDC005761]|uniref:hypothetical protein n=1 Tax=Streptomyces sp. NPDC005761 TaxID=3157066 RepID=UPI0034003895